MASQIINYPLPGQFYKHYKGGTYKIITCANLTDDNSAVVVYESIPFGGKYVRKLEEFLESIDKETVRFKLIENSDSYLSDKSGQKYVVAHY